MGVHIAGRGRRRLVVVGTVAAMLLGTTVVTGDIASAADQTITVDGQSAGRTFDGVGGISAGASSRLLHDYPEPERGQLLDYLFKPDYGASLQILKVEIGGDTNATDGAEPSHERTRGSVDCNRGYEWWLMEQAKARNPDIKIYALEWGAPSWFRANSWSSDPYWSQDNVDYVMSWLGCAAQHGVHVDYLGGRNESSYVKAYYEHLNQQLAASYPDIKIVAADETNNWRVATAMRDDASFRKSVDIVGVHDPCVARTLYQECPSSADAKALDMPLWDSETSSEAHDVGAGPLARSLNRDYLDGAMTGHLYWGLIASWYADLPIADTGLALAENPWSGHYDVGGDIWTMAHTTQFTEPGWRYLDQGSGYLTGGASYVSLRSPDTGDYSTVIETMDATEPQTVTVRVGGGLSTATVHEWVSDPASQTTSDDFLSGADLPVSDGEYTVTLQPGHLYTLSTTTGQHKGDARPSAGPAQQLALPFTQTFDGYDTDRLARYFSDVNGGFQTEPCAGGREGTCYQQEVTAKPIAWHSQGDMWPTTLAGDPRWWGDYTVSSDVRLPESGWVELLGRVTSQNPHSTADHSYGVVAGDHLLVSSSGSWVLYRQDFFAKDVTLASGQTSFAAGAWHSLGLRFQADTVDVVVDGKTVGRGHEAELRTGQVGLRVRGWQHAQFDNLSVVPTGAAPAFVPHSRMSATATSAHTANYRGYSFEAYRAIDDRPETLWHSEFQPRAALPQSITLDLGAATATRGLTCQPRLDGTSSGMITGYTVWGSSDGSTYTQLASGTWSLGSGTRVVTWPARTVRYVRLTATAGSNDLASAGELNVMTAPAP